MALDLDQHVEFHLPLNAPTFEPHTGFVFTAEQYEGDPSGLSLVIACSEDLREHQRLDRQGTSCVFCDGHYGCRWAADDYDEGHLKAITLELTRVQ